MRGTEDVLELEAIRVLVAEAEGVVGGVGNPAEIFPQPGVLILDLLGRGGLHLRGVF
jgi:hypothetical protein